MFSVHKYPSLKQVTTNTNTTLFHTCLPVSLLDLGHKACDHEDDDKQQEGHADRAGHRDQVEEDSGPHRDGEAAEDGA